jgi:hypothetical protein
VSDIDIMLSRLVEVQRVGIKRQSINQPILTLSTNIIMRGILRDFLDGLIWLRIDNSVILKKHIYSETCLNRS